MQDTAPGSKPKPPANKAAAPLARTRDPLVQWLTIGILIVLILWLAAVVSAFVFGMFNISGAPRTQVERDLAYYSAIIQSGKGTSQTFASYADALVRAGQLSKASDVLTQGLNTAKTDRSYLYAEQAQLYLTEKQYQSAVSVADTAMAEAQKEHKAAIASAAARNITAAALNVLPDSYGTAALAKAGALVALKDYAGAVKAFDVDLTFDPTSSDVLVARGLAKAHLGNNAGAAADFRAALKFIPDYQPALDGLKQIGASR